MPGTRVVAVAVLAVALLVAAVVVLGPWRSPGSASPLRPAASSAGREPGAVRALAGWDRQRAAAWAHGSTRRLASLYVAGSAAGARDVAALQAYRRRGFTVTGLRMQLLEVTVLARDPDRWRLAVTDRLAGGTAVRAGRRTPLPRDRATRHVVTLMRSTDGNWRVASVAAPP